MKMLTRIAGLLQSSFGPLAEQAGRQSQVIVRQRKFTASTLAQSFILALLAKPTANAEDIASMATSVGVDVTHQAVQQRYSPALAKFFRVLFSKMTCQIMCSDTKLAPLLARFTSVTLLDSSVIQLPESMAEEFPGCGGTNGSCAAAVKLQTELELGSGQLRCVQLEPGKSPDQATDRQHIAHTKGSLRIADLGYFSLAVLRAIAGCGAYFLSRVQYVVTIEIENERHSLIDWLVKENNNAVDQMVLLGTRSQLACRLIAWRVPGEIASRRREKLRKRMKRDGRTPSQKALAACDWNFLITNAGIEKLSLEEAIVLYRCRWQIELLFKRWKSYCQIDLFDSHDDVISMSRFWIRLCAALLQHWLLTFIGWSSDSTLSFAKIAKRLPESIDEIASSLSRIGRLRECLEKIKRKANATCRRTTRSKKPGTIELLRNPNLLEYALT